MSAIAYQASSWSVSENCMKWSDMTYDDFYIPYDENQRAIRGFLLTALGVDLNNIPAIFNEYFAFYESESQKNETFTERKIYLSDIIGTSYQDYGDKSIIQSYMRIKRAPYYITQGKVTRGKYFRMLKIPVDSQSCPIKLSKMGTEDRYWVDGNGNHRIILYKIIMLAEIAEKYEWARSDDYDINYMGFTDIRKKYWLKALVRNNIFGGKQDT